MMMDGEKKSIRTNDKYLLEHYKKKLRTLSENANNRKETMRWLAQKL